MIVAYICVCKSKYIYITLSQKFGFIIKLVTFRYIPGIVIFFGFINAKITK